MTIATKKGDKGKTSLIGGARVSKAHLRVEAYGMLDELGAALGFARSICELERVGEETKTIQKELFTVSASLATPKKGKQKRKGKERASRVTQEMVDRLSEQVTEIEAIEGVLGDWALPGENTASAAYDVARTTCRRAERAMVRLRDAGKDVDPLALVYVNRLSDLIWLYSRLIEKEAGVNANLRESDSKTPRWSRAW